MTNGSALEEKVFSEAKRLCYAGHDATTLLREVSERLRRVVPFDAYCAHTMDPLSGLITGAVSEEAGGEQETRLFLEHIYFEDDINEFNWMVRNRRAVALLSEATGGKLERALRHREALGPLMGLGHELRGVFTAGRELWGGTAVFRELGRPDFDAREVAPLYRIAPHLGAGLKAAALRLEAAVEQEGDSAPGLLTLDPRGRVLQHTLAAERWLRELGDLGPRWREGRGLPLSVWTVVGALRRALKHETDRDLNSVPRICARTRSGRWLTLYGSLTEPRPASPGEVVIIIEPAGAREMAWLQLSAYSLSNREREVVERVMGGASTKEISTSLYISEATVQEHLSNVFDKVGVRSRQALIKRLYLGSVFA